MKGKKVTKKQAKKQREKEKREAAVAAVNRARHAATQQIRVEGTSITALRRRIHDTEMEIKREHGHIYACRAMLHHLYAMKFNSHQIFANPIPGEFSERDVKRLGTQISGAVFGVSRFAVRSARLTPSLEYLPPGTIPREELLISERHILAFFGMRLTPRNVVTARQMVASCGRLGLPNNTEWATMNLRDPAKLLTEWRWFRRRWVLWAVNFGSLYFLKDKMQHAALARLCSFL